MDGVKIKFTQSQEYAIKEADLFQSKKKHLRVKKNKKTLPKNRFVIEYYHNTRTINLVDHRKNNLQKTKINLFLP